MGGARFDPHILAQWTGPETGQEVTLYEDGTVQIERGAPVELIAHLLAEWHNHLKGKIA